MHTTPVSPRAEGAVRPDELRAALGADPVWSAYAIADLQPAYAPYCRWLPAHSASGRGLVLLFTRLDPPVLFATGDVAAVTAALDAADLPDQVYMTLREEHAPAAERHYDFSADRRPMWRMALVEPPVQAGDVGDGARLVRLTPAHTAQIRTLIAHGGAFAPARRAVPDAEASFWWRIASGVGCGGRYMWRTGRRAWRPSAICTRQPGQLGKACGGVAHPHEQLKRRIQHHIECGPGNTAPGGSMSTRPRFLSLSGGSVAGALDWQDYRAHDWRARSL